jgi:hypothetical protein
VKLRMNLDRLRTLWLALGALWLVSLGGCSLISIKSPEKPLSAEELNARILTREVSAQFISAVERSGDRIAASEDDNAVLENTLRWEIRAIGQSRRAATQMAPNLSLLDTWALAEQLKAFVGPGGAGAALFGTHQGAIREICDDYATDAEQMGHGLLPSKDYVQYRDFIAGYVQQYPLRDLTLERTSVVVLWSREHGGHSSLVNALGTIPQALADSTQRLQIYGETVPGEVLHETELALRQSGYSRADLQAALQQLDERMARLATVAESTPQLVQGAEAEVRQSLREVLDRLSASSRETGEMLRTERIALFADLQTERQAIMADLDQQRQALAKDSARIGDQLLRTGGRQVRALVGEVLLLVIVLTVILLGLPFAAGHAVGRARERRVQRPD